MSRNTTSLFSMAVSRFIHQQTEMIISMTRQERHLDGTSWHTRYKGSSYLERLKTSSENGLEWVAHLMSLSKWLQIGFCQFHNYCQYAKICQFNSIIYIYCFVKFSVLFPVFSITHEEKEEENDCWILQCCLSSSVLRYRCVCVCVCAL